MTNQFPPVMGLAGGLGVSPARSVWVRCEPAILIKKDGSDALPLPVGQVIYNLVNIVNKSGNMLLHFGLRPAGNFGKKCRSIFPWPALRRKGQVATTRRFVIKFLLTKRLEFVKK
jgi:hypothetical protein